MMRHKLYTHHSTWCNSWCTWYIQ